MGQEYIMKMEYFESIELTSYWKEDIIIDEPQIAYIMQQILTALQYMHSKHVIHGDLKP